MLCCPKCESVRIKKAGLNSSGDNSGKKYNQRMFCNDCRKYFTIPRLEFNKKVSTLKRMQQQYYDKNIFNIGYLDIETDGQLKGDFGEVLTAVMAIRNVKTDKEKYYSWCVSKKDAISYNGDRQIVKELFETMKECDLLIGHYFNGWKKFDMPFLRVRAEMLKINIPVYKMLKYGDTWNMAHSVLNLQSYSLDGVCRGLGIPDIKTRLTPELLKKSRHGNKKALAELLDHNLKDVIMTIQVHRRLEKLVPVPSSYV